MLKLTPFAALPDVLLVEQENIFRDSRGVFLETFRLNEFGGALGLNKKFKQGCMSVSHPFVLRGLHYQTVAPQGKLVRAVAGSIYDVMVDLRQDSPTFKHWAGVHLDAREHRAVYVPPGFAHGFVALAEGATVYYETTDYHLPDFDRTLAWNDPTIGIVWPFGQNVPLTMSAKDRSAKRLADFNDSDYPI